MELELNPGKYIVAVSGGVDSVVLLDLLAKSLLPIPNYQFIVAHFDHGIRENSVSDRLFVEVLAHKYGVEFEFKREELGAGASEALSRERRYNFFNGLVIKYQASGIVTAHHKDDVLETACINLLRGTHRKGLNSLISGEIIRPLLSYRKQDILNYANSKKLEWREDSTNIDMAYLRNFIRAKLASADEGLKSKLEQILIENQTRNNEIDELVDYIFKLGFDKQNNSLNRGFFIGLPYSISLEILAQWLRELRVEFDKKNLEILVVRLKTGKISSRYDAGAGRVFKLSDKQISLEAK